MSARSPTSTREHRRDSSRPTLGKDPRHVQVVLDESREVLRASHGVLICVTHHGFICANAGVDASNVPGEETLVLLPKDPDASARDLRARIRNLTNANPADRHHRLVRPRLAPRAGRHRDRLCRAGSARRLARPPRHGRARAQGHLDRGRRRTRGCRGPRPDQGRGATRGRRARRRPSRQRRGRPRRGRDDSPGVGGPVPVARGRRGPSR